MATKGLSIVISTQPAGVKQALYKTGEDGSLRRGRVPLHRYQPSTTEITALLARYQRRLYLPYLFILRKIFEQYRSQAEQFELLTYKTGSR